MSGDSGAGSRASAVILVSSPAAALGRGFALALAVLLLCLAIFVPCETPLPHAIFTAVAMADAHDVRVLS
jgi:hypothetical protein